jgi:hypothetical protein
MKQIYGEARKSPGGIWAINPLATHIENYRLVKTMTYKNCRLGRPESFSQNTNVSQETFSFINWIDLLPVRSQFNWEMEESFRALCYCLHCSLHDDIRGINFACISIRT